MIIRGIYHKHGATGKLNGTTQNEGLFLLPRLESSKRPGYER